MRPFGDRLAAAMDARGPLCVGIDPHPALIADWGLPGGVAGLRELSLRVVDALAGHVAALKPQAAFFERHGSAGVAVLAEVVAACRAAGQLCIVDAKRGDIGSTMAGYAEAYVGKDSDLAADAVTLSPYLGFESLLPAIAEASATGRGVFVLCLTSNPEGAQVQHAREAGGVSVAARVAAGAGQWNAARCPDRLGDIGLVVGATVGDAAARLGVDLPAAAGPLLAPGIGAQGATPADLPATFPGALDQVLAASSRGVLGVGGDPVALREAARRLGGELAEATGRS